MQDIFFGPNMAIYLWYNKFFILKNLNIQTITVVYGLHVCQLIENVHHHLTTIWGLKCDECFLCVWLGGWRLVLRFFYRYTILSFAFFSIFSLSYTTIRCYRFFLCVVVCCHSFVCHFIFISSVINKHSIDRVSKSSKEKKKKKTIWLDECGSACHAAYNRVSLSTNVEVQLLSLLYDMFLLSISH